MEELVSIMRVVVLAICIRTHALSSTKNRQIVIVSAHVSFDYFSTLYILVVQFMLIGFVFIWFYHFVSAYNNFFSAVHYHW